MSQEKYTTKSSEDLVRQIVLASQTTNHVQYIPPLGSWFEKISLL